MFKSPRGRIHLEVEHTSPVIMGLWGPPPPATHALYGCTRKEDLVAGGGVLLPSVLFRGNPDELKASGIDF